MIMDIASEENTTLSLHVQKQPTIHYLPDQKRQPRLLEMSQETQGLRRLLGHSSKVRNQPFLQRLQHQGHQRYLQHHQQLTKHHKVSHDLWLPMRPSVRRNGRSC